MYIYTFMYVCKKKNTFTESTKQELCMKLQRHQDGQEEQAKIIRSAIAYSRDKIRKRPRGGACFRGYIGPRRRLQAQILPPTCFTQDTGNLSGSPILPDTNDLPPTTGQVRSNFRRLGKEPTPGFASPRGDRV